MHSHFKIYHHLKSNNQKLQLLATGYSQLTTSSRSSQLIKFFEYKYYMSDPSR
jgi:hypothetical protein